MTSKNFYRLLADPSIEDRWFLGAPIDPSGSEIDARIFTDGVPVPSQPRLHVPVGVEGTRVGFNFAAFDMLISPAVVNEKLEELVGPAIQRIPVVVGEDQSFEILNVCERVACLDDSRSQVMRWTASDGRPDKVGQYRMVIGLKIDGSRVEGRQIFRVAGWGIALIVSDDVKRLLEKCGLSGVVYQRVD
nr:DUF1629 domain-containing protein [uncultured Roseateles sp.]